MGDNLLRPEFLATRIVYEYKDARRRTLAALWGQTGHKSGVFSNNSHIAALGQTIAGIQDREFSREDRAHAPSVTQQHLIHLYKLADLSNSCNVRLPKEELALMFLDVLTRQPDGRRTPLPAAQRLAMTKMRAQPEAKKILADVRTLAFALTVPHAQQELARLKETCRQNPRRGRFLAQRVKNMLDHGMQSKAGAYFNANLSAVKQAIGTEIDAMAKRPQLPNSNILHFPQPVKNPEPLTA